MKLRLAHILLKHAYELEDLQRKLKEGHAFAELAKRYSQCPSASQGGELGFVPLSRLEENFALAAEQLRVGEISPVVRTRFGHHLILRLPEED